MNERDEINYQENNVTQTPDEVNSTPEAPSTDGSAPENDNAPKKGRAKLVKRIILGVGLPLIALIIIFGALFLTLNPSIAIENTLETFGVNIRSFSKLEQKFQTKGVQGYYNVEIPYADKKQNSLLTLHADVAMSPKEGVASITLSNTKNKNDLTVNFVYTDKFMALGQENENYTGINLENIKTALDTSIFHPDSNSKFALSKSDYDAIVSYLEGDKSEENVLDEETIEEITEIYQNLLKILKTEDKIVFSKEPFGLCKRVEYTVDKTTLTEISEYLKKEFEENEKLAPIFKIESIEKAEFEDLLDTLLESYKEDYFKISYLVYLGRIKNITISTYQQTNETESIANEIIIGFNYGTNNSSIKCTAHEEKHKWNKTIIDNATAEITLSKNKKINTYVFTALDDPYGNGENEGEVTELHGKLIHNTDDGKFYLTFGTTEERKDLYVEGNMLLSNKKGEMRFTLTRFVTAEMDMDWEVIDINLKVLRSSPDTDIEYDNILTMDADKLDEYIKNLPFKKLDKIVAPALGADTLFSYSSDDRVIFDTSSLIVYHTLYSSAYADHIRNNISNSLRSDCIFIYNEEMNLYFVMQYRKSRGVIEVDYYYDLPSDILKKAHEAKFEDSEFVIHKLVSETEPSTCKTNGIVYYTCTICNTEYREALPLGEHKFTEKKGISFLTDDNKSCKGTYSTCSVCNCISFTSNLVDIELSVSDKKYYLAKYDIKDKNYSCFHIPEEITNGMKFAGLKTKIQDYEFKHIRIPEGLDVLDSKYFYYSSPITMVIPSSLTEIKSRSMDLSILHTVYYIGTETEWKKIDFSNNRQKFNLVNLVFVTSAPEGQTVVDSQIDLLETYINNESYSSKTVNDRIMKLDGLKSIVQSDKLIYQTSFDKENGLILINCHYDSRSYVYVYDLEGKLIKSFECPKELTSLVLRDNYAVGYDLQRDNLYLLNILTGEINHSVIGTTTSFSNTLELIDGKCYYISNNRISVYDIQTQKHLETLHPYSVSCNSMYYIEEKNILVTLYKNSKGFNVIDFNNGNKATRYDTDGDFQISQTLLPDYLETSDGYYYDLEGNKHDTIPNYPYNKSDSTKLLSKIYVCNSKLSVEYYKVDNQKVDTYVQSSEMSEPFIINSYSGGNYFALDNGDVLFNTGYGVYIIEAK